MGAASGGNSLRASEIYHLQCTQGPRMAPRLCVVRLSGVWLLVGLGCVTCLAVCGLCGVASVGVLPCFPANRLLRRPAVKSRLLRVLPLRRCCLLVSFIHTYIHTTLFPSSLYLPPPLSVSFFSLFPSRLRTASWTLCVPVHPGVAPVSLVSSLLSYIKGNIQTLSYNPRGKRTAV